MDFSRSHSYFMTNSKSHENRQFLRSFQMLHLEEKTMIILNKFCVYVVAQSVNGTSFIARFPVKLGQVMNHTLLPAWPWRVNVASQMTCRSVSKIGDFFLLG